MGNMKEIGSERGCWLLVTMMTDEWDRIGTKPSEENKGIIIAYWVVVVDDNRSRCLPRCPVAVKSTSTITIISVLVCSERCN